MAIIGHGTITARPRPAPQRELTPADVAQLLRIDVGRVYTMAQRGLLPVIDNGPGPRLRFDQAELEAWLRSK